MRWRVPMHPIEHVLPGAGALLDIGCNTGAFLRYARERFPQIQAYGVDLNFLALRQIPRHEIASCQSVSYQLPFADEVFSCVTCIQVFEHIPPGERRATLEEIWRVLKPGGRFVLSTPHAGITAWADPNNLRFRWPRLYRALIRTGLRDRAFTREREVIWHDHFHLHEIRELAGTRAWKTEYVYRGGCLTPFLDLLCWPLYRLGLDASPVNRWLQRLSGWDLSLNLGRAGYNLLIALRKAESYSEAAPSC